jgi:FkbM family methyltransferase
MLPPKSFEDPSLANRELEHFKQIAREELHGQSYFEGLKKFSEIASRFSGDKESCFYLGLHCLAAGKIETAKNLLSLAAANSADNYLISFLLNQITPLLKEGDLGISEKTILSPGRADVTEEFLRAMVEEQPQIQERGIEPRQTPVLVTMNGDPMWFWGDQLRYIWHVLVKPFPSATPECRAETEHYDWVKSRIRPGDTILDIGSNLGLFTCMMSRLAGPSGRVHAFEPNPVVLDDLRRIIKINQLANVSVHEVAASNRSGVATFIRYRARDVNREASRLTSTGGSFQQDSNAEQISVTTTILDQYLECQSIKPDLIKMDIEGAEIDALQGLSLTIEKCRPKMVIEYHANPDGFFDHDWMRALLLKYDYRFTIDYKNYFCDPS